MGRDNKELTARAHVCVEVHARALNSRNSLLAQTNTLAAMRQFPERKIPGCHFFSEHNFAQVTGGGDFFQLTCIANRHALGCALSPHTHTHTHTNTQNRPVGTELYSHAGDTGTVPSAFDDFENVNLANDPAYAQVKAALLAQLQALAEQWMTPLVPTAAPLAPNDAPLVPNAASRSAGAAPSPLIHSPPHRAAIAERWW